MAVRRAHIARGHLNHYLEKVVSTNEATARLWRESLGDTPEAHAAQVSLRALYRSDPKYQELEAAFNAERQLLKGQVPQASQAPHNARAAGPGAAGTPPGVQPPGDAAGLETPPRLYRPLERRPKQ